MRGQLNLTARISALFCWLVLQSLSPAFGQNLPQPPAPGKSKIVDEIRARGSLRAAAIGVFPWLPENTSGSGPQFSGPGWMLANELATLLGVKLEIIPVSHETKVPILATHQADISIPSLAVTEQRQKVIDYVLYTKSTLCLIGLANNPKLQNVNIDDLNSSNITGAYFIGTPPQAWLPVRFPQMTLRGVSGSGANAPIEEITSKRADVIVIDNVAWPQLRKSVSGLISFPKGDACLDSTEFPTPAGFGLDKNEPEFRDWMQAVADAMHDKLHAEELRVMKEYE